MVGNRKDFFRGTAEGTGIEMDLISFCSSITLVSFPKDQLDMRKDWLIIIPSALLTCTSFQNLLYFAVPPPLPLATARRSCPLCSSSACFLRLATLESTCSALGTGGAGGGPGTMRARVAGSNGELCIYLCVRNETARGLEELRVALQPPTQVN